MNLEVPLAVIYGFLLVLARVTGFFLFVPIPAFRSAPETVRMVLSVMVTISLYPVWPQVAAAEPSLAQLTLWAFSEAGFGLATGLSVAFLTEGFQMAAQSIGLQAGYSYASTIDPSSEADSNVMAVLIMLSTNLLIFGLGIDHQLIRLLALSFERLPAGSWTPTLSSMDGIIRLGGGMFTTGLRLALPVVAVLLLVDVALGLLGRIQQQLQLLSLAFPVKMLAALALLAILAPMMPRLLQASTGHTLSTLRHVLER